jgi:hypothetical protein
MLIAGDTGYQRSGEVNPRSNRSRHQSWFTHGAMVTSTIPFDLPPKSSPLDAVGQQLVEVGILNLLGKDADRLQNVFQAFVVRQQR